MHYLEKEFVELLRTPQALQFLDSVAADGFWYKDLESPENQWTSPNFWHALGFDPSIRTHRTSEWHDLIFPEDHTRAQAALEGHCANPEYPYDQQIRYRTADGGTVTVKSLGFAIREGGVARRMVGAHTIVHDTRAQDQYREMAQIIEICSEAIIVWTEEDGIHRWNQSAEQLYGITQAEAKGKHPLSLTAAELPVPWEDIQTVTDAGLVWSGDIERRHTNGSRLVTSTRIQRVEVSAGRTLYLQVDRDETARYDAQQAEKMLTAELHHRVKNLFAVIKGIVSMSMRYETDAMALGQKLSARISSLAAAHFLSIQDQEANHRTLSDIVDAVLAPYADLDERLIISGETIEIPTRTVNPLCLILHELATNAFKYGAWSSDAGKVDVSWSLESGPKPILAITWAEKGSTLVQDPADNTGFGTQLIDISARQLNSEVSRLWQADGLKLHLSLDISMDGS